MESEQSLMDGLIGRVALIAPGYLSIARLPDPAGLAVANLRLRRRFLVGLNDECAAQPAVSNQVGPICRIM